MNDQKIKNLFFAIIIFALVIIINLFLITNESVKNIILIILICSAFLYLLFASNIILQLKDYERAVIFTFGKVNRVGGPGWTIVLPIIEKHVLVSLRTQVVDVPVQQIITKDNIRVTIDAILYLSVDSAKESVINSVIKVEDYKKASSLYVISRLRDVLGEFDLANVITNTESINKKITESLKDVAKEWGIKINAVEIRDLQIPEEIIESMHRQKAAVQRKLAVFEDAESEKAKIVAIRDATDQLSDKTMLYYYIKALEKIGEGQSSKIIFPMEVTNLLQSVSKKLDSGSLKVNKTEKEQFAEYLPLIQNYLKNAQIADKPKKKKK
ncbi:MAG: SPFH domain-containing protein [archaeon]|jgi:regulator of protease activity HflC (stomatin/prohibitin superfamily)